MSGTTSTDSTEEMVIAVPEDVPTDRFGNSVPVDVVNDDEPEIISVRSKGPGKPITIHDLETKHGELNKTSSPDLIGIQKQEACADQSFQGDNTEQPETSEGKFTSSEEIKSLQGHVKDDAPPAPSVNLPLKKRSHLRHAAPPPYTIQGNTHEEKVKKDLKNLPSGCSTNIPLALVVINKLAAALAMSAKNKRPVWIAGKAYQLTEAKMQPSASESSAQPGPHHGTIDRPPPASSVSSMTSASDISETEEEEGIENWHHQPIQGSQYAGGWNGINYKPGLQMIPKMGALSLNSNCPGIIPFNSKPDDQPLDLSVKHPTDPEVWMNSEAQNLPENTERSDHEIAQVDDQLSALYLQQNPVNPNGDPERWQESVYGELVEAMKEGTLSKSQIFNRIQPSGNWVPTNTEGSYEIQARGGLEPSNPERSYRMQTTGSQELSNPEDSFNIQTAGDQLPSNPDGSFRMQVAGGQEPTNPEGSFNTQATVDQEPSNPEASYRMQTAGGQDPSNPESSYNMQGNRVPIHQAALALPQSDEGFNCLPNFASLEVTDDDGTYRETAQEKTRSCLKKYLVNRN